MKQLSREDRQFLTELVKLFEDPASTASRYRRFAFLYFSIAFLLLSTAGCSRIIGIEGWEGPFLIIAGVLMGISIFYRIAARQVLLLIMYSELKIEDVKAALLSEGIKILTIIVN